MKAFLVVNGIIVGMHMRRRDHMVRQGAKEWGGTRLALWLVTGAL
jgi:hypothetical protein